MAHDIWHYSRSALVADFFDKFSHGTQARAIYAPARMGKTEFLQKDLAPAALARGYRVSYVDIGNHDINQEPGVARALLSDFDSGKAQLTPDETSSLATAAHVLDMVRAPHLLLLDNAHSLAHHVTCSFALTLRTLLNERGDYLKVVYAGRSLPMLQRIFEDPAATLYRSPALETMPLLGDDFVKTMVARANSLTRFPFAVRDAELAFRELRESPAYFRVFVDRYLTHASEGVEAALEAAKAQVFSSKPHLHLWGSLGRADRCILRALAAGETDVYSAPSREKFARALGVPDVLKSSVQNALTRLAVGGHIVVMGRGQYELADEDFAAWVRDGARPET